MADASTLPPCGETPNPIPLFGTWEMQPLSWVVAMSMILCFFLAGAMGANDVSNAFGTSVGAGVISVRGACIIAAIFDFLGAVLMGQGVASTIRKGIIDVNQFQPAPELLMFGNFCAVVGATAWVGIATVFRMPVSTTHAVIGAILGFGILEFGLDGVDWMGVLKIVISWFASPVLAGVCASVVFLLSRTLVLRCPLEVALKRIRWYVSFMIALVIFLAAFFVVSEKVKTAPWWWLGPLLCAVGGVVIFLWLMFTPLGVDKLFQVFKSSQERKAAKAAKKAAAENNEPNDGLVQVELDLGTTKKEMAESTAELAADFENVDVDGDAEHVSVKDGKQLERFDDELEQRFSAVQVMTAAYLSFCHGANDIANVAGPLATVWGVYESGEFLTKANTPIWILCIMGVGIICGLAMFGYRVMQTMGENISTVTPSRGFSMEMGTATSVLVASYIHVPVSTTQCAVGSVVFVGMLGGEGLKAVNWKLFTGIVVSWVVTLPVAGLISAFFYWLLRPIIWAVYPHTQLV